MTIESTFWNAVEKPENKHDDGSVNWNYVDVDIWLENTKQCERMGMGYQERFNVLINRYNHVMGAGA